MIFSRPMLAPFMCVLLIRSTAASAYDLGVKSNEFNPPGLSSEYIYRIDSEEPLIPVYLLGAVAKPGLYHVPRNTDIIGLLTLAGGTTENAELNQIVIKGQASGPQRQLSFDLNQAVHGSTPVKLSLVSNDLVYVTPGRPTQYTALAVVGLIAAITGIVASAILIKQNVK